MSASPSSFRFNYSVRFEESISGRRCCDKGRPELTDEPNLRVCTRRPRLKVNHSVSEWTQGQRDGLAITDWGVSSFTPLGGSLLAAFQSSAYFRLKSGLIGSDRAEQSQNPPRLRSEEAYKRKALWWHTHMLPGGGKSSEALKHVSGQLLDKITDQW